MLAVCLLCAVVSPFAGEGRSPSLGVVLPHIGTFNLGEVVILTMPSPMVRIPDQPQAGLVIPEELQKEWEEGVGRQWLRVELKKPVIIEFSIKSLGSYAVLYSRSLYISPQVDDGRVFGKLNGNVPNDVTFRYFVISVDADESEKIETKRSALIELGKNKNGITLRGKLVRVETSATHLFNPGTQKIDFLDFYIKDVEFVKY